MTGLRQYYLVFFSAIAMAFGGAANLRCVQCECCTHEKIEAEPEEVSCCSEQIEKSEISFCTLAPVPSCRCTIQSAQAVPAERNRDLFSFENKTSNSSLTSLSSEENELHQVFSERQTPGLVYGWSARAQSFLCRLNC